jgi:hypothetical protein
VKGKREAFEVWLGIVLMAGREVVGMLGLEMGVCGW